MSDILFSGAGGSGYVKKSDRSDAGGQTPNGKRGRVAPPKRRVRPVRVEQDEDAPRRRVRRASSESESGTRETGQNDPSIVRRTTSRRGFAGRRGVRRRREG